METWMTVSVWVLFVLWTFQEVQTIRTLNFYNSKLAMAIRGHGIKRTTWGVIRLQAYVVFVIVWFSYQIFG